MEGASALHQTIRKMINESLDYKNISDWEYGTVVKSEPLEIMVNQKITLTKSFLEVLPQLSDYKIKVEYEKDPEPEPEPQPGNDEEDPEIIEKEITIKNSLEIGDRVILLKKSEGQRYLVLAKITQSEAVNSVANYRP